MPPLISINGLSKSFGSQTLFEDLSFGLDSGDRVGLIGPNGAGKTTLLKILAQKIVPDAGQISSQRGLKTAFLEQSPALREGATVREIVLEGASVGQEEMEAWEIDILVNQQIDRLGLDPEARIEKLSGGWKKRAALARELAKRPDLLFLDEPTNHLDVDSILWLEKLLASAPFATLTVTHDRLFLNRISNRILELDRRNPGGLLSVLGNYADYLDAKEQLMSAQEKRESALKNTLRRESEWLRRGPKARTTKQQARIQRAGELQEAVRDLSARNRVRTVSIDFQNGALPKKLLEARGISKSYGGRALFSDLDFLLSPGSRFGLLGANGSGKSTLIRVLLGEEEPDQGTVRRSDQLAVAYFEQNRETLDPQVSLADTLCPHGDYVEYRGQRVHIKGYLDRFLFQASQMDLAVGRLSGGEQSRILIAKLMLQPANLLVLDEPTNDLDLATLNVLQDCLTEFEGSILLVTHDRYFLDQVANKIIAFPPPDSREAGHLGTFSDLAQWEDWFEGLSRSASSEVKENASILAAPAAKKKKLSYLEQREFDGLEGKIAEAEKKLASLQKECELPANAANAALLMKLADQMASLRIEIDELYRRWDKLSLNSAFNSMYKIPQGDPS